MAWGSDGSARRTRKSVGGFQSPPQNDLPRTIPPSYSYQKQSPGYTRHVVEQAQKKLGQLGFAGDDLGPLFEGADDDEQSRLAREYFAKLDRNEQAALREVHFAPLIPRRKPETVVPAWNIGD